MITLRKHVFEASKDIENPRIYKRKAARAVIINGNDILLIYTKRYNDYTIPGGGVDDGENIEEGLLREINEETGAENVKIIGEIGIYEELRPYSYKDYDLMDMKSYIYLCDADKILGEAKPESYEIKNGSEPVWVDIDEAISHNKETIEKKDESMGLSILRELFLLEYIKENYMQ